MKPGKFYITAVILISALTLISPVLTDLGKFFQTVLINNEKYLQLSAGIVIKEKSFLYLRVLLIGVIVILNSASVYYQIYRPFKKIEDIRNTSFDFYLKNQLERSVKLVVPDLRFSVMQKRKEFGLKNLFRFYCLSIIYEAWYENRDIDKSRFLWVLRLGKRVFSNKSYCLALEGKRGSRCDIEEEIKDTNPRMKKKLGRRIIKYEAFGCRFFIMRIYEEYEPAKALITMPVFKWLPNNKHSVVGVVNIDTKSENGRALFSTETESYMRMLNEFTGYVGKWF